MISLVSLMQFIVPLLLTKSHDCWIWTCLLESIPSPFYTQRLQLSSIHSSLCIQIILLTIPSRLGLFPSRENLPAALLLLLPLLLLASSSFSALSASARFWNLAIKEETASLFLSSGSGILIVKVLLCCCERQRGQDPIITARGSRSPFRHSQTKWFKSTEEIAFFLQPTSKEPKERRGRFWLSRKFNQGLGLRHAVYAIWCSVVRIEAD